MFFQKGEESFEFQEDRGHEKDLSIHNADRSFKASFPLPDGIKERSARLRHKAAAELSTCHLTGSETINSPQRAFEKT